MGQHLSPPLSPSAAGTLLRHDLRPDRTGWTVCDATNGQPVRLGGTALIGLGFADAEELVCILNRQDLEIEREARRLVLAATQPRAALCAIPRRTEAVHARP